jgi:Uma2 family endonuclease
MSITTPPTGSLFQPPPYPVRKFTVSEYHRLIQARLLTEDDPVELLEGWIVPKMPRNPPHDGTIGLIQEVLRSQLPVGWCLRIQSAITLSESEPEPDLVIAAGTARQYVTRHPLPQDLALVIEVADSSLDRDRHDKGRIYSRAALAVYWIVNLVDDRIEVYTAPSGPGLTPSYQQRQDYQRADSVPLVLAGQTITQIAVHELLP